jgi:UDP-3-O-[3-hydroxymyristoyl] glucosamine N-acyltransferase
MKLAEIAARLNCRLEGDGNLEITGVSGIAEARPGHLTFLSNPRYASLAATTEASAILLAEQTTAVARRRADAPPLAALRSKNPYLDFARAIEMFYQPPAYAPGIHPTAVVAAGAKIGPGAHIGPHCFVDEDVVLGRNAVLHSFVSIYRGARIGDDFFAHSHSVVREHCRIGNRVILQNGVVVGSDGLGFAKTSEGRWYKMLQSGPAVIEDDVEIQANACIDRATVGETRIRRGAKIDNLVQVGHACEVGEDAMLCAQVGLAGSSVVGKGCILAGQAALAGHLEMGDGAVLTAQSASSHDLAAGGVFSGSPALPNKQWLRCVAAYNRLPQMQKTIRELQAEVERLRTLVSPRS